MSYLLLPLAALSFAACVGLALAGWPGRAPRSSPSRRAGPRS